ncbi:MAG: aminotransferase class I/II-fold pyridoxal phosphate-dependent enzyme [Phycisphaeraceae bacterium]|nr:aminotransferase class I/II-fold pyridoxal phosphate-dependent enzyme [Phycisphaeraceae bacterium]MCB9848005.1 aminotransferase class I/II-fold pyridoxal phosphate-dependent enzyme [Phycisphaeraceae bacterium]
MDFSGFFSERASSIDTSGIRRIFHLGAHMKDPINLSIGQPDFPVPDAIKRAAIDAINNDHNGYTLTQGIPELRAAISKHLMDDLGWDIDRGDASIAVTGGTSGALLCAALATLGPGDEAVIPDPYFVLYPSLPILCGARPVLCDTYPDFRMTAERVEPLITSKTKFVLVCSPSNPCGVVNSRQECEDLLDLCRRKNILLISDEIYDEFTFPEFHDIRAGRSQSPSPARFDGANEDVLVIRGFGKTYGCTGWRMGYVAGPTPLVDQIAKLQQYSFVCAPSIAQWGCVAAFGVDQTETVLRYQKRRDMVVGALREHTNVATPGGAFYVFPEIPPSLGITGRQFVERAIERNVLTIPGNVFSKRDTHVRLSYATDEAKLERGVEILCDLMQGN